MRAGEHVDAVDLVQMQLVQRSQQVCGPGLFRTAGAEALGGERDAACQWRFDTLDHGGLCRLGIEAARGAAAPQAGQGGSGPSGPA